MESGIYIRVDANNYLLEELSFASRDEWLHTLDKEGLIRTVHILCNTINQLKYNNEG